MKIKTLVLILLAAALVSCQTGRTPECVATTAFAGRDGAFVLLDCASGRITVHRPEVAAERLAPCSTFKIWNTLIGLESEIITTADAPFYTWDGKTRAIPGWNRDLNLRYAFQASCVPAFQNLARDIGPAKMQSWINTLGYGNQDLSAGVDCFWLPAPGRKTILISPQEQAELLRKLVLGKTPFSMASIAQLKTIMKAKETSCGILYGKTGSGTDAAGNYTMGWYVGWVEGKDANTAFACLLKAKNATGKDARDIVEIILAELRLL